MQIINNHTPNHGAQGTFVEPITIDNSAIDYVYVLMCRLVDETHGHISSVFRDESRANAACSVLSNLSEDASVIEYYIERHILR